MSQHLCWVCCSPFLLEPHPGGPHLREAPDLRALGNSTRRALHNQAPGGVRPARAGGVSSAFLPSPRGPQGGHAGRSHRGLGPGGCTPEGVLVVSLQTACEHLGGRALGLPRRRSRAHGAEGLSPVLGSVCSVTRTDRAGATVAHEPRSAMRNGSWRSPGWERLVQGEGEGEGQAPGPAQAVGPPNIQLRGERAEDPPGAAPSPAGHSSVVQTIRSPQPALPSAQPDPADNSPETSGGGQPRGQHDTLPLAWPACVTQA